MSNRKITKAEIKQLKELCKNLPKYPEIDANGELVMERRAYPGDYLIQKRKEAGIAIEGINPKKSYTIEVNKITDPFKTLYRVLKKEGAGGIQKALQRYLDNHKKVSELLSISKNNGTKNNNTENKPDGMEGAPPA